MARKFSSREVTLMVVLGGAAIWALWTQATKEIGPGSSPSGPGGKGAEASVGVAPAVRMDLLEHRKEAFDGGRRDLFQYSVRPPSAEELRRRREEAERQARAAELEAQARQEAAQRQAAEQAARAVELMKNPPKPPAPQIPLKYLGYFGPKDAKIAAFEDGEEVLVARVGEVVKGQFKIVEIRYESVVMGYTSPQFRNETRELAMAPTAAR